MKGNGKLKFDARFFERSTEEQLEYLQKLAASQNEALDAMQKERNALLTRVAEMGRLLADAQTAFDTQKDIAKNLILHSNAQDQQTAQRIHELEAKLKAHGVAAGGD